MTVWSITFALTLTLAPFAALADDAPVLAEYFTNSGTLPPKYAWSTVVTLREDGSLTLKHCRGYDTEGPACQLLEARVPADEVQAIRDAALASGLAADPAEPSDNVPVGGGTVSGAVYLDGQRLALPAFPVEADQDRVAEMLRQIEVAIPERFDSVVDAD